MDQYQELCRHFVSEQAGLREEQVMSVTVPNPRRAGLPEYKHQIDLYWETGDSIALYLNIANAKWRGTALVDQPDLLLLQQVRQQVAAHKAFMITNTGFTAGAVAAAKDHGIALHVVAPTFDTRVLPRRGRLAIGQALRDMASPATGPLYLFRVENRGLGFAAESTVLKPAPKVAASRVMPESSVVGPPVSPRHGPSVNRQLGGRENRAGFGFRGGSDIVKK